MHPVDAPGLGRGRGRGSEQVDLAHIGRQLERQLTELRGARLHYLGRVHGHDEGHTVDSDVGRGEPVAQPEAATEEG